MNTFMDIFIPPISERGQLAELMGLMCQFKGFTPTAYGTHEPIRTKFDATRLEEISARLLPGDGFIWKGQDRVTAGSVYLRRGIGKQTGKVTSWTDIEGFENPQDLTAFLRKMVTRFGSTFGFAHYLSREDAERGYVANTVMGGGPGTNPMLTVSRFNLVRCLPELYWGNVYGPEYTALFGRERILSAPAPLVEEIATDTFYIQLSDNILDFQTRYADMDSLRERVKTHLGRECFFSYQAKFKGTYRVPKLGWNESPRPPLTAEDVMSMVKGKGLPSA